MASYRQDAPGAVVAVIRRNEVLFAKGYGLANLEYGVAITPRTAFYLASAGKQFTAYAVALLASEGRLSLDDPVQKYVPELGIEQPVTIRQLLHHTGGLRDFEALLALAGTRRSDLVTQSDLLAVIAAERELNFLPGTEHLYSNSGYTLLATVVERVTKQSFRQFLRERVFKPLGMADSFVGDDAGQIIGQRADSYVRTLSGFAKVVAPFSGYGSGGIYSTAEDLGRWLGNFEQPRVGGTAFCSRWESRAPCGVGSGSNIASGSIAHCTGGSCSSDTKGSGPVTASTSGECPLIGSESSCSRISRRSTPAR